MDARRAPLAPLLAGVLALAACLASAALAASPILWVTPLPGGAATLATDGTVSRLQGGDTAVLARGARGDSLQWCGGVLLAIDGDGNLRSLTGQLAGPSVSPHSRPACLGDGRLVAISSDARSVMLLAPDLSVIARQALNALPDADPTPVGDAVAVLSQPTQRYRHGVLGDEVEAGAVTLLSQADLSPVGSYAVEAPAVIEQRRVTAFAAAGRDGMLITRSTPSRGAAVVALAVTDQGLVAVAAAPPIGAGERWLNLFAAVGRRAYAVRTPHLGGPLERYLLTGDGLEVTRYALDVTNHVLGSRNLDLGVLLPPPRSAGGLDVLALPTPDLRRVQLVACGTGGCAPRLSLALADRLSSNLAARWQGSRLLLYAGEEDGRTQRFTLDAGLWQAPPTGP